jgi:hypothetical protein
MYYILDRRQASILSDSEEFLAKIYTKKIWMFWGVFFLASSLRQNTRNDKTKGEIILYVINLIIATQTEKLYFAQ